MNNLFGIDIDTLLKELWDEEIVKQNDTTDLDGAEYSEHITMLQRNSQKVKLALRDVVIRTNQYLLDHMSSKTDLNNVRQSLASYIRNEKIASSINDSDITKLVTVSILKLLKDEVKTDYQSQINVLKDVLKVSDSTLDELREIVAYIKLNREILSNLHITKMAGYSELNARINSIDILAKDNRAGLENSKKGTVLYENTSNPGTGAFNLSDSLEKYSRVAIVCGILPTSNLDSCYDVDVISCPAELARGFMYKTVGLNNLPLVVRLFGTSFVISSGNEAFPYGVKIIAYKI